MSKEAVNHPQHYGGENNQYEALRYEIFNPPLNLIKNRK